MLAARIRKQDQVNRDTVLVQPYKKGGAVRTAAIGNNIDMLASPVTILTEMAPSRVIFCASFSEAFHSFMRHHLPFRRGKCSRTRPSRSWRYI